MTATKKRHTRGPTCGHSRCSQNYIDSGETQCVNLCAACGELFTATGPASESLSRPEFCVHCVTTGYAEHLYPTE